MSFHAASNRRIGAPLVINWPACGAAAVTGLAYTQVETFYLLHIIPLSWKTTWVRCSACGEELHSSYSLDRLHGKSPEELVGLLYEYVPLANRVLAICTLLLCVCPFFGLILGSLAVALNRRSGRWSTLSRVGLGIAVMFHVLLFG